MLAKFSFFTVAAMSLVPFAFACGGDDDGGGRIMVQPDAGGSMDAPSANCTAAATYSPTFSADTQLAETETTAEDGTRVSWSGLLNMDQAPDILFIDLFEGYTVFSDGIKTGTFELTGPETSFATCGICVAIATDFTMGPNGVRPTDIYFATGGTVTLTSVEQDFVGTISNLTLTHVNIAMDLTTTPFGDGCDTTITSASIEAPIEVVEPPPGPMNATGGKSARTLKGDGAIPVRLMVGNRVQR